jgi:energy-coupling factor transporter ATP-binding protein EcfA2
MEAKNVSMWYGSKRAIRQREPGHACQSRHRDHRAERLWKIDVHSRAQSACTSWCPQRASKAACSFTAKISTQAGMDPAVVRRRVGMVFQKSNPFPTMSIGENTIVGLRLNGVSDRKFLNERLEQSLRMAALWDEVKDDLHKSGT